jgi:GlpG protein
MRQIATLPDEAQARTLSDHLLTLGIETRLESAAGAWEVWVCDEDKLARAREELAAFTANPADERFSASARGAEAVRLKEWRQEQNYRRRQERAEAAIARAGTGHRPLTLALMTTCIVVAVASNLGEQPEPVLQGLHISSYTPIGGGRISWPYLSDIRAGQVWRLVTPIFIHFGLLHLVFNMTMLYIFGTQIETRRGTLRFLALVLVLAVFSNLAQYYLGRSTFQGWRFIIAGSPQFGGMSGVLYGLFGYLWVKSVFEPELNLSVDPTTVAILIIWFVVCLTGILGPIGNVAHAAGLTGGLVIGYASTLWRRWRQLDV